MNRLDRLFGEGALHSFGLAAHVFQFLLLGVG